MYEIKEDFTTPLFYYEVIGTQRVNGKTLKNYSTSPRTFFASFKTYGGTESTVNGLLAVEDTATVKTWYDPMFASGARVKLAGTDQYYEIIGEPEDVEQRHKYSVFKVRRIKGGA